VYWNQEDYVAIGAAAHGHRAGRRHWNLRTPERYVAAVRAGATTEAGAEELEPDARAEEALFLAVRTRRGIPVEPEVSAAVDGLVADGLLARAGDRAVLTRRGRLLASDVTARLLVARAGPLGVTAAPAR
jgi:oxygen-independent coproporphyrinogen-3 oxidase